MKEEDAAAEAAAEEAGVLGPLEESPLPGGDE